MHPLTSYKSTRHAFEGEEEELRQNKKKLLETEPAQLNSINMIHETGGPHTNQRPGSTQNRRPRNLAGNIRRHIGDLAGKSALQNIPKPRAPLPQKKPL